MTYLPTYEVWKRQRLFRERCPRRCLAKLSLILSDPIFRIFRAQRNLARKYNPIGIKYQSDRCFLPLKDRNSSAIFGHDLLIAFSCQGRGYAECGNMLSGGISKGATSSGSKPVAAPGPSAHSATLPILQPWSDAISWSGGRNLLGRSWGDVTDSRTSSL